MESETEKRRELHSLFESIKLTQDLNSRILLIRQLENFCQFEASDRDLMLEYLVTFWEDSTSLGVPECMLNNTILTLASKHLESFSFSCLNQHQILVTKACRWCDRCLVISTSEAQDENVSSLFYQIALDALNLSSSTISAMTSTPVVGQMTTLENFILELMNLIKDSIINIKKIKPIASELLKVSQFVLDGIIKLCRAYFDATKCDIYDMFTDKNGTSDGKVVDSASCALNVTVCTINKLCELGTFAASGGGNLVTILNISWKGVVSLLQLGKGILARKTNVGGIILNLVSMAIESLRCAFESWSVAVQEPVTISEAKRAFLPIKFYIINAVRISSEYPCEAINLYREITHCVLLISSLIISFSKECKFRVASEVLIELLEPTSFLLLLTLFNSSSVKSEMKLLIFDWLFKNEIESDTNYLENSGSIITSTSLESMFVIDSDAIPGAKAFTLGRFILFLNFLKASPSLREEILIRISGKLENFMHVLGHEDVYSSVLGLQMPVLCSGSTPGITWQPLLCFTLHSLKTYILTAVSSCVAWTEIEAFLLQYIFHPHPICMEITTELWCFLMRYAEKELANYILDKFYSLLKFVAPSESVLDPNCSLRKLSRQVCVIFSYADPTSLDEFYDSVLNDHTSHLSTVIFAALLMEGFPLDSLSDDKRRCATQNIITSFYGFIQRNILEFASTDTSAIHRLGLVGLPVHTLSSALHNRQITDSDTSNDNDISKFVKFACSLVHAYKTASDDMKSHYIKLLGATLVIISNFTSLYGSVEMEKLIMELHALFTQCPTPSGSDQLHQCKGSLASFLANLSFMEIEEDEGDSLCNAIWELYHMLLRERHWALIHLTVIAFSYFAARTSCTQLWRFVPHNAALSYDTEAGNKTNEDWFMSELKGVLEKEVALPDVTSSTEQLALLLQEGAELRKLVQLLLSQDSESCQNNENHIKKRKRKLPDGISDGMELLERGLKVMKFDLTQSYASEFKDAFSSHILCLENAIFHLKGLTDMV